MRLEYYARIRLRAGSYHINLPAGEVYKLMKHLGLASEHLAGTEVKVEVSL